MSFDLAFVIPVVSPNHATVKDYTQIERLLAATVRSCLHQRDATVQVIIVGHRIQDSLKTTQNVTFLNVEGHRALELGNNGVAADKGLKHALGALEAISTRSKAIMFVDADDFVHRDLAKRLPDLLDQTTDGILLTNGMHALIDTRSNPLRTRAVFEVNGFHSGCGTCRIFHADTLQRELKTIPTGERQEQTLNLLNLMLKSHSKEESLIRCLGRHTNQATHFRLTRCPEPLAAKGLGHVNHVGISQGAPNWNRITRTRSRIGFARDFGLEHKTLSLPDFKAVTKGAFFIARRALIPAFKTLSRGDKE